MPRGDRTGPMGYGPRTGRGLGYCNGYPMPGFMNPGFGRGMGKGFGFRRAGLAPVTPVIPEPTKAEEKQLLKEEIAIIEDEKKALDQELSEIKKRLSELK